MKITISSSYYAWVSHQFVLSCYGYKKRLVIIQGIEMESVIAVCKMKPILATVLKI